MNLHKINYNIIRFTPDLVNYKPKFVENNEFTINRVDYDNIDIPIGKSRIGGPVVDLPIGIDYPENLFFAAQLNLKEFKNYYFNDYLPTEGFLYFFVDHYMENGKVIYANCDCNNLKRIIKEHDDQFFQGCLIKNIYNETEHISERYDKEWAREGEYIGWNSFAGFEKSKLFGMYTNCQCEEREMIYELSSSKILLLQIGEDFNEDGILSVRIEEKDLLNRKFENCIFEWSQS